VEGLKPQNSSRRNFLAGGGY